MIIIEYRDSWHTYTSEHKEQLLRTWVASLPTGFTFKRMERFARFGLELETGIFQYGGREFVFVPGDRVTLGWSAWSDGPDEQTREELISGLQEAGGESMAMESALQPLMSPVREAEIGPMLIERHTQDVGWYEVEQADLDPSEDEDVLEAIESFKESDYRSYEAHQSFRLDKEDARIRIWLYAHTDSQAEWAQEELPEGFGVLTEEEWEYVYGGGCRTLFPWGDSFDYGMKLLHFENEQHQSPDEQAELSWHDRPYDLAQSNGMGLFFTGDPYKQELTVSTEGLVRGKGGDGGTLICGGMGITWGYLPVATYYRDPYEEELEWEDRAESLYYRRIIRMNTISLKGENTQ